MGKMTKAIFLMLGLLAGVAEAATCTSVQDGNWNTTSTWSCTGGVTRPGAGDSVVIVSPHTVTLDGDRSATNLQIDAGATLNDGNNRDLTLSGNAVINGSDDATGNGGNLIMTGNGTTLSGTGTIIDINRIQIDANVTIPASSNLNLTLDSEIRVGNNAAATLTIDGTLDGTGMNNGTRFIRLDNNNTSNVVVNGVINAPNSYIEVQSGGTVTNNGTVAVQYLDGNGNATATWTQGANSNLTFTSPAVSWVGAFNASALGNTVTFNGTATPFTPETYYNLSGSGVTCPLDAGITVLGATPCGPPAVPTVTTNAATGLTVIGATLNGTVSSNGASTTVTFDYGLTTAYGSAVTAATSPLASGAANVAVSAALTGLTCGTTYHFRAKGVNSAGTTHGGDLTFSTSACPLPTVTTDAATALTTTGAVLNGTVNDNGSITTVTFEYGTTAAYGSALTATQSPVGPGWGSLSVSSGVSGLNCGTTYHYRVSGVNSAGASNGGDLTFTTTACPTGVSVTASPTVCVNAAGVGTLAWTAFNAVASDNLYATRSLGDNQQSNYLKCTGYGFAIPVGVTINGITVNVERSATRTNSPIRDLAMRVVKAGVIGATDRSTATTYPTTDTVEAHGGAADLWGLAWTTADINNANFGAALAAQKAGTNGGTFTVNVDHMPITVNYTPATPWVASIDRTSVNPTAANTSVSWDVLFSGNAVGVDTSDFVLVSGGSTTGASITSVTGSGRVWTVTANTGTGATGTLGLNLVDNDTIMIGGVALGGAGANNGNFTGQIYTLEIPVCNGTMIYCDDFERANPGAVGKGWTVVTFPASDCAGVVGNTGCAGVDSDIPPFNVATSLRANPTRSMFTRWSIVSVDSPAIDLSGRPAALLSFWMRRGGDAFSEYPEAVGEDYLVQYFANDGTWKILAQYPTGVLQGQVFTPVIQLPVDALHANFKLRFYQPAGSGDANGGQAAGSQPGIVGYDYWHFDNVIITEAPESSYVGAFCDNFEAGLGRWSVSAEGAPPTAAIGDADLKTTDFNSATHELDLRWGYVAVSTLRTDMTGVSGNIEYWLKSGTTAARDPDAGEDLLVEYRNSSGVWTTLATYLGADAAGTIYNGSHVMPADAKHTGFRLRFRQLNGSSFDNDYWHVDDVCVGTILPNADLAITKARGGSLVPGSNVTYTLSVTNNGPDALAGSIEVVDTLPAGLSYYSANGTGWTCSANGQDVTCSYVGTLNNGAVAPAITLIAAVDVNASGIITNTATVTGTVTDTNLINNTAKNTGSIIVASLLAEYHLEEFLWNGTAGEVKDTAGYPGGPFNGTAIGSTNPAPALSAPALSGNPGTCGYSTLSGPVANGGAFSITGLPVSTVDGAKTSVAFWMYWDGTDSVMPIGWGQHDLWFQGGSFGFNTGNTDIYGISSAGLANGWHHVVAVFTNGSVASNLLYIDGANQTLTQRLGTPNLANAVVGTSLRAGGWTQDTGYRFTGRIDELLVYRDALVQADVTSIYNTTHACVAAVDHYELSLPTSGISCLSETATVTACANASSPCTLPSTVISGQSATLATSAGTLASTTVTFNAAGVASTTLSYPAATDGASATVTLSGEQVAAINSRKCCPDGASCVVANSCATTFSTAGFIFSSAANGAVATLPTQVAGTSSGSYFLRSVKTSTTTQACEAGLTGANPVDFAYECNNPTTCSSGNLMSINGGAATTISRNDDGGLFGFYSYTPVNMTFDANGNAPFTLNYSDVGQVKLYAKKTLADAFPVAAATLTGTSSAFVVKPGGFVLSNIVRTSDSLANPGAADATGAAFAKAGEAFSVTVTATTSGGATTPNYGNETVAESVQLTSALVAGLGLTNDPGLSNSTAFGTFTNGVATGTTFAWNEVGIITLAPNVGDADYLGAGDVTGTASGNVGRFYAGSLALSGGIIANRTDLSGCAAPAGCGTFTYMGEQMSAAFNLTAKAVDGTTTLQNYNYSATPAYNFAKLNPTAAGNPLGLGAVDIGTPRTVATLDTTTYGVASGNFVSGVATVTAPFAVTRGASPSGPFEALDIGIAPVDGDGAALVTLDLAANAGGTPNTHGKVGSTKARYGRMKISNAHGSELLQLPISVTAQYWNGTAYVTNALDNHSTFATSDVVLSNPQKYLSLAEISVVTPPASVVFVNGAARYTLAKPSGGDGKYNGSVDMIVNALSIYLPSGNSARATFGVYKGNNEFIYMREVY